MNNSKIIGISAMALVIIVILYFLSGGAEKYNWKTRINDKTYEPYDVGFFKDVLSNSYGDDFSYVTKYDQFETVIDSGMGTMLYLNSDINLSIDHIDALLKFIERGNTAFYSSDNFPSGLISEFANIFLDIESEDYQTYKTYDGDEVNFGRVFTYNTELGRNIPLYITDSMVTVNIVDSEKSYNFSFHQKDTLKRRHWLGIPKIQFNTYNSKNSLIPHSYINDSIVDCFSIKKGDGELFIHLNPLMFGNIYFTKESGFNYVQQMTECFNDGELYYNKRHSYRSRESRNINSGKKRSPFTFIFKHKSLTWALYGIIILSALYVIFGLKRKLPILRDFDHPKNSSIRFVRALSSFYKTSGNYADLCKQMMVNFEHFLRKRYKIKTDLPKEELQLLMSKKSGISLGEIESIYKLNMEVEYGTEENKSKAIKLHKAINKFYKNCK